MEEFKEILKQFETLDMDHSKEVLNSSMTSSLIKKIQSLENQLGFSIYYVSHTNQPTLTTKGRIFLQLMSASDGKRKPTFLTFNFDQKEKGM